MNGVGGAASGGGPGPDAGRRDTHRRVIGGKQGGPWLALSVQAGRVSAAIGDDRRALAYCDERELAPDLPAQPDLDPARSALRPGTAPEGGVPGSGPGPAARRAIQPAPTSRLALSIIDRTLKRAGIGLDDLAGLCVADGPGPFTAIRVAMSLIQGIGVARRLPAIATPSLAALAVTVARGALAAEGEARARRALVLTAVDARMGECYFGAWLVTRRDAPDGAGSADRPAAMIWRPVEWLASDVGPGERIRPAFDALIARARSMASGTGGRSPSTSTDDQAPLLVLAGSGFKVDPVLASWRPDAGQPVVVESSAEADAIGVLTAALAPRAAGDDAPDAAGAATWGPVAAAGLRPRYVRDKVALDVDEQRRLAAARDAASSRG